MNIPCRLMRQEPAFGGCPQNALSPTMMTGLFCFGSVAIDLIHQRDKPAGVFMNNPGQVALADMLIRRLDRLQS